MPPAEPTLIDSGPLYEETGLAHKVLEPNGPGPYRTVVMLHGRYGDEDVMWIFAKTLPVHWLKIAPRGIVAEKEGGYSWLHQEFGQWPGLDEFEPAVTAVADFISALPRLYNADPQQIYLMGFSQGAAVSYATAMSQPGLVQAVAGLVGFMPEGCDQPGALHGLEQMPMFMAVGLQDERIPYARSLGCATNLRQAGSQLDYHEYETGHKLNAQGLKDLTRWWQALG